MKIVYDYPPNYATIARAFNIKDNPSVVFTYGDTLFAPNADPNRLKLDKPLLKHEETHSRQQSTMGAEVWWSMFLEDPGFRFKQELEAYREQYRAMSGLAPNYRAGYLDHISGALASEIYGNLMTKEEATIAITEGIKLKYNTPPKSVNDAARKSKKRERQNRKRSRG